MSSAEVSIRVGADDLDALAEAVFGGNDGPSRLEPLLRRWDEEVGTLHEDDPHYPLLQALRVDWALCDATIEGGRGPGDTWAARVASGRVEGIGPEPRWRALASTFVGLFEVWPSRPPFLRDRLRGPCMPLDHDARIEPIGDGPAALWEVRVCIVDGHAHLCRGPLPYPLELVPLLEQASAARFAAAGEPLAWSRLRRAWLAVARAPRPDEAAVFGRLVRG